MQHLLIFPAVGQKTSLLLSVFNSDLISKSEGIFLVLLIFQLSFGASYQESYKRSYINAFSYTPAVHLTI